MYRQYVISVKGNELGSEDKDKDNVKRIDYYFETLFVDFNKEDSIKETRHSSTYITTIRTLLLNLVTLVTRELKNQVFIY